MNVPLSKKPAKSTAISTSPSDSPDLRDDQIFGKVTNTRDNLSEGGLDNTELEDVDFLFSAKTSQASSLAEDLSENELEEIEDEYLDIEDVLDFDYLYREDLVKETTEEAESESEDDANDFSDNLLKETMKHQRSALVEKAIRSTPPTRTKSFAALKKLQEGTTYKNEEIEESWHSTLSNLSASYFNSQEARIQNRFRTRKGVAIYKGVSKTPGNSKDIRSIWNMEMSDKVRLGRGVETWQQFSGGVGQFVRMSIALKLVRNPYDL